MEMIKLMMCKVWQGQAKKTRENIHDLLKREMVWGETLSVEQHIGSGFAKGVAGFG